MSFQNLDAVFNLLINFILKGNDSLISVKAPGKLYIAGEYAVVEKGTPSIIVALNQFITVNIEKKVMTTEVLYLNNTVKIQSIGKELTIK